MLVPPESSSAVFVMIRSKSVSICNHCRFICVFARRVCLDRLYAAFAQNIQQTTETDYTYRPSLPRPSCQFRRIQRR